MSRWKYPVTTVTVGENFVTVRGLTAGERAEFLALHRKIKANEAPLSDLTLFCVKAGVVPALSEEEVREMPGELFEAAQKKVLELSGMDRDEPEAEKKDAVQVN